MGIVDFHSIVFDPDDAVYMYGSRPLLEVAERNAYSIENMEGHEAQNREVTYIGTIQRKNRLYMMYKDSAGDYWYKVMIQTPQGAISEYQSIFGKREKRRYRF